MVLVIDNYDSFTYNLVQYLGELGAEVQVMRNDVVTLDDVVAREAGPHRHLAGAGPAGAGGRDDERHPADGAVDADSRRVPRAIRRSAPCSAARWCAPAVPMHGKTSTIEHDGRGVFAGIQGPFVASRYHSLVVADDSVPADLIVSARTKEDATIMGLRHRTWPVHGVQFHPESILTGEGKHILRNFLEDR